MIFWRLALSVCILSIPPLALAERTPEPPSDVKAFVVQGRHILIQWSEVQAIQKYNIYLNGNYETTVKLNKEVQLYDQDPGIYEVTVVSVSPSNTAFSVQSQAVRVTVGDGGERKIEKLLPDTTLKTSYAFLTQIEIQENSEYFGINPIRAVGDSLFLGVGTSLPAGEDGAGLYSYQKDTGLKPLYPLSEQGIMTLGPGALVFSPGVDPCCGDLQSSDGRPGRYDNPWDWGNAYFIDPLSQLVSKQRNLPQSIHGWGGWYDARSDTYYYAGSGHLADTPNLLDATLTGQVFASNSSGAHWALIADRTAGIGNYRTYDIIGIGERLYVQWADLGADGQNVCGVSISKDQGQTWQRLPQTHVTCATRFFSDGENLIYRSAGVENAFHIVDPLGVVHTKPVKGFVMAAAYHNLAQDNDGYFYTPTNDGRVMRTKDFESWLPFASVDSFTEFHTIAFWSHENAIVLGSWGSTANLYLVPVD